MAVPTRAAGMPPEPNAFDRAVEWLWPRAGLRRRAARLALRAYEAASPKDSWRPRRSGASPAADHMADAARLRTKARFLVQNVPYCAAALEAKVADVVGTGIIPRFLGKNEAKLNALFDAWSKVCDADGAHDFHGLIAAAYRAMEQDGEVLLRFRDRRVEDKLPVPLQLQLLEIDYLDTEKNTAMGGMGGGREGVPTGNDVIEGIEYDLVGRRVAYWLWLTHPGDSTLRRSSRTASRRIPASEIIHLYEAKRPGQHRGITRFAPVITRARDTQLLEDAELARKNLESRLSVLVSGDASLFSNPMQLGGTATAGSPDIAKQTGDLGQLASGGMTQLPIGSNVTTVAPVPVPGHVENIKWHVHLVTAALGVTYEAATGDMREVNYSSARVRRLDVRRLAEQQQWLVLMPRIERIIARMVLAAEVAGLVPDREYTLDASTPRWEHVDPSKEVDAELKEVAGGLVALSEQQRRRGYKPELVAAEWLADMAALKANGGLDVMLALLGKKPLTDPAAEEATKREAAQQTERVLGAIERNDERAGERYASGAAQFAIYAARLPVINVTVPERSVEVRAGDTHVNVPERSVTVESPVTVNNEAAQVSVEHRAGDTHVSVPEREIHIDGRVSVSTPPRSVQTDITRDDKGRMKCLKQIEVDV